MNRKTHLSGLRKQHIDAFFQNHKSIYKVGKQIASNKSNIRNLLICDDNVVAMVIDPNTNDLYHVFLKFLAVPVRSYIQIDTKNSSCGIQS